ncbi:WYL domain-containing protein [soil metagenome]
MPRPSADDRLRRLLALVPWVASADGPTLEEVCARLDLTEEELLAELDLVFLCGVHPFTPDALIDVLIEHGRVWIRYADYFARPLRLTPEEGLQLVAGGAALLAVPGADPAGPLARGRAKVAGVLGIDPAGALDVELGAVAPDLLETLRSAVAARRVVEIDYYAYGRDARTHRVVEPERVYTAEGEWYLDAWCPLAEAPRRFRVERIRSIAVLDRDRTAPPPARSGGTGQPTFEPSPEDVRVVLELEPRARWVVEQYPVEGVEELGGGRLRVTLAAGERAWLERLLLRLGPLARAVSGADGVASAAAGRVLARYERPVASDS